MSNGSVTLRGRILFTSIEARVIRFFSVLFPRATRVCGDTDRVYVQPAVWRRGARVTRYFVVLQPFRSSAPYYIYVAGRLSRFFAKDVNTFKDSFWLTRQNVDFKMDNNVISFLNFLKIMNLLK